MNILFTTSAAPEICPFFTSEKRPPLGLGSLMAVVLKEGHNVFFVDNYLKPTDFVKEGYLQKNKTTSPQCSRQFKKSMMTKPNMQSRY